MPTTTSRGFRIPLADGSDSPNVHLDMRNLGIDADADYSQDVFSNRPPFGHVGRRFYATDSGVLYLDIGTAWVVAGKRPPGGIDRSEFPALPRAKATAASTVVSSSAYTVLPFALGSENYDTDNFHSPTVNPSRMTIPFNGVYQAHAEVAVRNTLAEGDRVVEMRKNGTTVVGFSEVGPPLANHYVSLPVTVTEPFVTGDYLEILVLANTGAGGVADASGTFQIIWLGN
jgi:hypothetical protein